jgi:hypothetical protein
MIKLMSLLKEVEEAPKKLYCDLDGVLVDFEKGYENLTGKKAPGVNSGYNAKEFWEPITKAGVPFWSNLDWMPDGKELWDHIKKFHPSILSAPSRDESSRIGKKVWMKKHLPGVDLHLKAAEQKQDLAKEGDILIDDRIDNCRRWQLAGGTAIHHTSAANTIQKLKDLGY